MIISGKKIVTLTREERDALFAAQKVLNALSEALGNDEYNFNEISDALYHFRVTEKFEIDFAQE